MQPFTPMQNPSAQGPRSIGSPLPNETTPMPSAPKLPNREPSAAAPAPAEQPPMDPNDFSDVLGEFKKQEAPVGGMLKTGFDVGGSMIENDPKAVVDYANKVFGDGHARLEAGRVLIKYPGANWQVFEPNSLGIAAKGIAYAVGSTAGAAAGGFSLGPAGIIPGAVAGGTAATEALGSAYTGSNQFKNFQDEFLENAAYEVAGRTATGLIKKAIKAWPTNKMDAILNIQDSVKQMASNFSRAGGMSGDDIVKGISRNKSQLGAQVSMLKNLAIEQNMEVVNGIPTEKKIAVPNTIAGIREILQDPRLGVIFDQNGLAKISGEVEQRTVQKPVMMAGIAGGTRSVPETVNRTIPGTAQSQPFGEPLQGKNIRDLLVTAHNTMLNGAPLSQLDNFRATLGNLGEFEDLSKGTIEAINAKLYPTVSSEQKSVMANILGPKGLAENVNSAFDKYSQYSDWSKSVFDALKNPNQREALVNGIISNAKPDTFRSFIRAVGGTETPEFKSLKSAFFEDLTQKHWDDVNHTLDVNAMTQSINKLDPAIKNELFSAGEQNRLKAFSQQMLRLNQMSYKISESGMTPEKTLVSTLASAFNVAKIVVGDPEGLSKLVFNLTKGNAELAKYAAEKSAQEASRNGTWMGMQGRKLQDFAINMSKNIWDNNVYRVGAREYFSSPISQMAAGAAMTAAKESAVPAAKEGLRRINNKPSKIVPSQQDVPPVNEDEALLKQFGK